MDKIVISEEQVKNILNKLLNEESSKVRREEFNRVQFKIEELQNSLNETLKEFRKLDDCIPNGLRGVCNSRVSGVSSGLQNAQKMLSQLKEKVKQHKKTMYSQNLEEKKK